MQHPCCGHHSLQIRSSHRFLTNLTVVGATASSPQRMLIGLKTIQFGELQDLLDAIQLPC